MNVDTGQIYHTTEEQQLALMRGEVLTPVDPLTEAEIKTATRDRYEDEQQYGIPTNRHERRSAAARAKKRAMRQ